MRVHATPGRYAHDARYVVTENTQVTVTRCVFKCNEENVQLLFEDWMIELHPTFVPVASGESYRSLVSSTERGDSALLVRGVCCYVVSLLLESQSV